MTPETALSWVDVIDKGGMSLVLIVLLIVSWKIFKQFLIEWTAWTIAIQELSKNLQDINKTIDCVKDLLEKLGETKQ